MGGHSRSCGGYEDALHEFAHDRLYSTLAGALGRLGLVRFQLGNLTGAEADLRRSREIAEHVFAPNDPNLQAGLLNHAAVLRKLNRKSEASRLEQRAKSTPGPDKRESKPPLPIHAIR